MRVNRVSPENGRKLNILMDIDYDSFGVCRADLGFARGNRLLNNLESSTFAFLFTVCRNAGNSSDVTLAFEQSWKRRFFHMET